MGISERSAERATASCQDVPRAEIDLKEREAELQLLARQLRELAKPL